jgi:hypothetical protein
MEGNKTPMKTKSLLCLITLIFGTDWAGAQGTAFTYQGRLSSGTNPANGNYDLKFTLYDALGGGNQSGASQTNTAVGVSNGLFAVMLDFGANVFAGNARWLQIEARSNTPLPNPSLPFAPLNPRQAITATPYSITAGNLTGPLSATQLNGTLLSGQLSGTYSGPLAFNNPSNTFAGNGSLLTSINATTLCGQGCNLFWNLLGNAGSTPGINFLGTTDNQPMEFKVNGQRALRLEPTTNAPNVIGGFFGNYVDRNVVGATIGGGGAGGQTNLVGPDPLYTYPDFAMIGGGAGNSINSGRYSTIAGGVTNSIYGGPTFYFGNADMNTISGGGNNGMGNSSSCTVSGGRSNSIGGAFSAGYCTIGGGIGNQIQTGYGPDSGVTISGGRNNYVSGDVDGATIGGGSVNNVGAHGGTIAGGSVNGIGLSAFGSSIGGGIYNSIGSAGYSTIAGGATNNIYGGQSVNSGEVRRNTISGGGNNSLAYSLASTIAGGQENEVGGELGVAYCTVGGGSKNQIIATNGPDSGVTISGGVANIALGGVDYSSIGGGIDNSISSGKYSIIAGGATNGIYGGFSVSLGDGDRNTISGGGNNGIGIALASTIAGGQGNAIGGDFGAGYCTIGGGLNNRVDSSGGAGGPDTGVTISGGENNFISGDLGGATIGGGSGNFIGAAGGTIAGGGDNFVNYPAYGGSVGGGFDCRVSGYAGTIAGGESNYVAETHGTVGGGLGNIVSSKYGVVPGGLKARAASYGQLAHASGQFADYGDAQTSIYVCRAVTTNATSTELFLDGLSERMVISTNSTWAYDILVTGRASNGNSGAYQLRGTIKNNAGTTTLVTGTPAQLVLGEDIPTWDATVVADNVHDALVVRVTGSAATSIRWVAKVTTVEVTY